MADLPERGDEVAKWLRAWRERFNSEARQPHDVDGIGWDTLDLVLDDYRLHADTGTPLDEEVKGGN